MLDAGGVVQLEFKMGNMKKVIIVIRGHTWLWTVSTSGPVTNESHNMRKSATLLAPPYRVSDTPMTLSQIFF